MSQRDRELCEKALRAARDLHDIAQEYWPRSGEEPDSPSRRAYERALAASQEAETTHEILGTMAQILDPCPECGDATLAYVGESCEKAREEGKFVTEDYYGDGSVYADMGVHHQGVTCSNPECDFDHSDVCLHD